MPTSYARTVGTLKDHSGTITTTGDTATVPRSDVREYLEIENVASAGNLWVNFGAAPSDGPGSFRIAPGGIRFWDTWCPREDVQITADADGVGFTCKEGY